MVVDQQEACVCGFDGFEEFERGVVGTYGGSGGGESRFDSHDRGACTQTPGWPTGTAKAGIAPTKLNTP